MPRMTQMLTTSVLSKTRVVTYKQQHSNENVLIARTLREHFLNCVEEPILDVGCGMGDIAALAFADQHVILLDRLDYSDFEVAPLHSRLTVDFFDYVPSDERPKTLLFCHVLQFLDEDVVRLADKLESIGADRALVVTNTNDGLLGEILLWTQRRGISSNPEVHVDGFPFGYACRHHTSLVSQIRANSFEELARQVCYLLDVSLEAADLRRLSSFLGARLRDPVFDIQQDVRAYERR